MTIQSNNSKIKFNSLDERKDEAKKELLEASDIATFIYNSRQLEPNENLLIRNFYYSVYHLVKAISVLDTGVDYSSHSALISYFNRENKKDNFLSEFNVDTASIKDIGKYLDTLFRLRDQYDYRDRLVIEEDYKEAESIWLKIYPELENIVTIILNKI